MAKILQLACGGRPKSSVIWDYFEYSIEKKPWKEKPDGRQPGKPCIFEKNRKLWN